MDTTRGRLVTALLGTAFFLLVFLAYQLFVEGDFDPLALAVGAIVFFIAFRLALRVPTERRPRRR